MKFCNCKAFTLVELMCVAVGVLLLAGALVTQSLAPLVRHKITAEDELLSKIAGDIEHTFEDADLSVMNVSALPGEIGPTDQATTFSNSTTSIGNAASTDWFVKVARFRGTPVGIGSPVARTSQPQVARIVLNGYNQLRLLVAAPSEANQQRYLLVSLMARPEELALPAFQPTQAWFDAIWNTDFNVSSGAAPSLWASLLPTADYTAWAGKLDRLRVIRITQKKWTFTVNATHLTNGGWVYWNNGSGRMQATANSGPNVTPKILAGRQLRFTTGLAEGSASLKDIICLRRDAQGFID